MPITNDWLIADITETVTALGNALFDMAEIIDACDDTCQLYWDEDDKVYLIRNSEGVPLFVIEIYDNHFPGKPADVLLCRWKG